MKQSSIYNTALCALMLTTAACSNELTDSGHTPPKQPGEAGKVITVTATQESGAQTDGPQTRLAYDFAPTDGSVGVTWAKGDKFFVGKEFLDGKAVSNEDSGFKPFTLDGEGGSKSGNFTGTVPTGEGSKFYGIYGDGTRISTKVAEEKQYIDFSYANQKQSANDNKDHLSGVDFMVATADETDKPNFAFAHLGAMIKFTLTLPTEVLTVKKLSLATTDNSEFFSSVARWEKGETLTFSTSATATKGASTSLKLGDAGITLTDTKILTAYMMVAPTTLTNVAKEGKDLLLQVTDADDYIYTATLKGADIEQGKYYTVTATLPYFAGGGSEKDPYLINDAKQLRKLATLVNSGIGLYHIKIYKLTNDIDLNKEEWTPIGTNEKTFNGSFTGEKPDGGNYVISNLSILKPTLPDNGLFGQFFATSKAIISNVTVSGNIKFTSTVEQHVGGIVGQIGGSDVTISNCISNCTIEVTNSANSYAGGIVGYNYTGGFTLTACKNNGSVSLTNSNESTSKFYAGGIIGYTDMSSLAENAIINGYNTGTPATVIGQYLLKEDKSISIKIREATNTGEYTTLDSGQDTYPAADKDISLGDRENEIW